MDDDDDYAMMLVVAAKKAFGEGLTRDQFIHAAGVFWDASTNLRAFIDNFANGGFGGETGAGKTGGDAK